MTEQAQSPRVQSRRRGGVRLLLTAGAVAGLASAAWWLTHPALLPEVGNEVGLPLQVGKPAVVGQLTYPADGSVQLRAATARVREGSADADVRVVFCVRPEGPLGAMRESADQSCARTPPLHGQRLAMPSFEGGFGHLAVEVVPREPGEIVIDGLDVAYAAGPRRGTQATGIVVRVTASAG